MCDCPDKDIRLKKCSCVLNWCSEFTSVFISGAEMNSDEGVDLTFINCHNYNSISSYYFHKQILPNHGKTYQLSTNL